MAAGLCETAEDWLWSSHTDVIYDLAPPWLDARRLLSYFATSGGRALQRYQGMVALPPTPALPTALT